MIKEQWKALWLEAAYQLTHARVSRWTRKGWLAYDQRHPIKICLILTQIELERRR